MPQMIATQRITLGTGTGKNKDRRIIEPGEMFDFTKEQIAELRQLDPCPIRNPRNEGQKEDSQSVEAAQAAMEEVTGNAAPATSDATITRDEPHPEADTDEL